MRFLPVLCLLLAASTDAFPMSNGAHDKRKIDKDIHNIFIQNQEWKESRQLEDANFFSTAGSNHKPNYMWIGCSDARVPANEVMGEDTGSVFVVRNVANMVVNTDFNLMGALQFAVDYLKIPHFLVCGHYDCGGIRASMEKKDHVPPLENWLRNIRDVYRLHRDELDAIVDPEQRHRRLVELNVVEQCINLFKTGVIQRRRVETFVSGQPYTTPRIHACVFDPSTGDLKRLDVDFHKYISELHDIYDLYIMDEDEVRERRSNRTKKAGFPLNNYLQSI
jgi:carbonic anhydrase